MLIRKLCIVLSLCVVSIFGQANLVENVSSWYPTCDNFGSVVDTSTGFFDKSGNVQTTFTVAKMKTENEWPYIELICNTPTALTGTDSIYVKYTCDAPLTIKLYQTDLGTEGNQSYALYEVTLPKSLKFVERTIAIKSFAQPYWADAESKAIALNLDNSSAVYFVPDLSVETGGTATVTINSLKLISRKK